MWSLSLWGRCACWPFCLTPVVDSRNSFPFVSHERKPKSSVVRWICQGSSPRKGLMHPQGSFQAAVPWSLMSALCWFSPASFAFCGLHLSMKRLCLLLWGPPCSRDGEADHTALGKVATGKSWPKGQRKGLFYSLLQLCIDFGISLLTPELFCGLNSKYSKIFKMQEMVRLLGSEQQKHSRNNHLQS